MSRPAIDRSGKTLRALVSLPAVRQARALLRGADARIVDEQIALAKIPAPPLAEHARAAAVRDRFVRLGLEGVEIDAVGNVVATLPALPACGDKAPVVIAAHLDTVFPADTEVVVHRQGGRVYAPGITDNARGLAALLALAGAVRGAGVHLRRPIVLAATVGEEGEGDLRGAKHLLAAGSPARGGCAFIALDGAGIHRIVHRGVGSRRLRVTLNGPGGHSWAEARTPNPIVAVSRLVSRLVDLTLPLAPRTALSATRIGGGTSINAIPQAAWVDVDLRSEGAEALRALEATVRQIARELEAAPRERDQAALTCAIELLGDRSAGETIASAELVDTACEVTRLLGARPMLAASSTDANVAMALGIPAIAIGAGGESGGVHTTREWFSNRNGLLGLERALLLVLAMAGVGAEDGD